jgi:DNA end-binding protein Ku
MPVRAVWKGYLKFGAASCAVKLVGATSDADKVRFRILNRKTRTPVKAAYLDEETGEVVAPEDQIKGFELEGGEYLRIEPEELKKLKLTSEHTLEVGATVALEEIDKRYLEKPYYLIPADAMAAESYAVIRDALQSSKAAARSCVVLYQRGREVVIEPKGKGMLMTTLRDHDEVLSENQVFGSAGDVKPDSEMVEIADLLIEKKTGKFDPSGFEDRYENALIAMLEARKAGRKPPKPISAPKRTNVVDLAAVLRKSLEKEGIGKPAKGPSKRPAAKRGKAAA